MRSCDPIQKPFLLDPWYDGLLESSAFRQRFLEKAVGKRSDPWIVFAMSQVPTVMCVALGFLLERWIFLGAAIWGGTTLLMFTIAALGLWVEDHRRAGLRRLAMEGDLVTGQLVYCVRKRTGPPESTEGTYYVEIKFTAMTPSGKEVQGTQTSYREDLLLNDPLPLPGTPVVVLMLDENWYALL